jgi:hypothetical protein
MIWAIDLAVVVTGKPRDEASAAIRRIPEEVFPMTKMITRSLPGKGNGSTKLVTFKDAVDLAVVVTGKSRREASQAILRIPEEVFPVCKMPTRSLPGKGNGSTKLVSFKDAIELVMVLPGKVARETRAQFACIIQRYIGRAYLMANESQLTSCENLFNFNLTTCPTITNHFKNCLTKSNPFKHKPNQTCKLPSASPLLKSFRDVTCPSASLMMG